MRPSPASAPAAPFVYELILTALLMLVIMAVATDTRAIGAAAAIAIGGTAGLAHDYILLGVGGVHCAPDELVGGRSIGRLEVDERVAESPPSLDRVLAARPDDCVVSELLLPRGGRAPPHGVDS